MVDAQTVALWLLIAGGLGFWFMAFAHAVDALSNRVWPHPTPRRRLEDRPCRWLGCPMAANAHAIREHRSYVVETTYPSGTGSEIVAPATTITQRNRVIDGTLPLSRNPGGRVEYTVPVAKERS